MNPLYGPTRRILRGVPPIIGLVFFFGTAVLIWFGISAQIQSDLLSLQNRILERGKRVALHLDRAFFELSVLDNPGCNPQFLQGMRRLLYVYDQIGDIEYVPDPTTDQTVATCSAVAGVFETPHVYPAPLEANTRRSRMMWRDVKLPFERYLNGFAIREGQFIILINEAGMLHGFEQEIFEIYAPQEDGSGFSGHLAGIIGLYRDVVVNQRNPLVANLYASACLPSGLGFFCIATKESWKTLHKKYGFLLTLGVMSSLLIGALAFGLSHRNLKERLSQSGRIRKAVRKGGDPFYCVYQPIVRLSDGHIVGCEVLARYEDEFEKIYPDTFIPIIERQNLTWEFTTIIMRQAFDALKPAIAADPNFKISINFYPRDLERRYLQRLSESEQLRHAAANVYTLNCEVLETGIGDIDSIEDAINYLHGQGFQVSIDDFGTGYSNLSQLREINAEFLKVDKSFIHGLDQHESSIRSSLVPHIVEIAGIIGVGVIAEGIETAEQMAILQKIGVEYGQGYYFSHPIERDAFLENLFAQPHHIVAA